MMGRICEDKEDMIAGVECFKDLAIEEGIINSTGILGKDRYSDNKFLNFKTGDSKEPSLYDNTWGEVILMCGLPGTGKDTYIKNNFNLPIISLDDIRKELKFKPGSGDGRIIQTAKERAREFLRKKHSFVWNATNLTNQRSQLIDLFETYGARVRVVYLETTPDKLEVRNHSREDIVPVDVINGMIGKLVLPEYWEAQEVEWIIV
jgi:predicted kinase